MILVKAITKIKQVLNSDKGANGVLNFSTTLVVTSTTYSLQLTSPAQAHPIVA